MRIVLAVTCLLLSCARPARTGVDRQDAAVAVGGTGSDGAAPADLAVADLAPLADASVDMPADLARADMTRPTDLTLRRDLTVAHDLATRSDMTVNSCAHSMCSTWTMPLSDGCNWCVSAICAQDSYCCTNHWSSVCVGEVASICKLGCS